MRSGTLRRTWMWATIAALSLLAAASWRVDAARITSVSPQGKVTQVRQVVVKFDEAMIAFGSPAAAAPAQVHCNDAAASSGQAHWIDDKTWAWDFAADLPPGVSCTVDLNDGLKSFAGHAITGPHRYAFQTGRPIRAGDPSGQWRDRRRSSVRLAVERPGHGRIGARSISGANRVASATVFPSRISTTLHAPRCSSTSA